MPIGVGINENVVLTKATIGEKNELQLTFDEAANLVKAKVPVFESLQSAKVENDGSTDRSIKIFTFKKPSGPKNEDKTEDELLEMISDDMSKVKNQLTQILELYLVSDDIKWDPFAGTGITNENYRELFMSDEVLAKIAENYFTQFINMVTPFLGNTAYKIRLKLLRQSADKHFATLPGRFLVDNPMVELMDVPAPKVKFTEWEIANGYNDGTPKKKPASQEAGDEPPTGKSPFGQR